MAMEEFGLWASAASLGATGAACWLAAKAASEARRTLKLLTQALEMVQMQIVALDLPRRMPASPFRPEFDEKGNVTEIGVAAIGLPPAPVTVTVPPASGSVGPVPKPDPE